jgi:hypothetical protein
MCRHGIVGAMDHPIQPSRFEGLKDPDEALHAIVKAQLPTRWAVPQEVPEAITEALLRAAIDDGVAEVREKPWGHEFRLAPHHTKGRDHHTASVHLSPVERAALRAQAEAAGLSVSETIRTALQACGLIP